MSNSLKGLISSEWKVIKLLDNRIQRYIYSCIDGDAYDVKTPTAKAKLAFLMITFKKEVGHWRSPQVGENKAFKEWIAGLPTAFHVEYRNYEIAELGIKWGILTPKASEGKRYDFIHEFFNLITEHTFILMVRHKIAF